MAILQNKFIREDGSIIGSSVIISCKYTSEVNSQTNLTVGDTTAAEVDVEIRNLASEITAGEKLTYYQIEDGVENLIGVFYAEAPTIATKTSVRFKAYDGKAKLAVDFSEWLNNHQDDFPMSLRYLVQATCEVAGVTLASDSFQFEDLSIPAFYADGVTSRQVVSWAAQIAGCFVACNTVGEIFFDWYRDSAIWISGKKTSYTSDYSFSILNGDLILNSGGEMPEYSIDENGHLILTYSGDEPPVYINDSGHLVMAEKTSLKYALDGLSKSSCTTDPIKRVQFKQSTDDVGVIYPADADGNVFSISQNGIAALLDSDTLRNIAQYLYNKLKTVTYTPLTVKLPKRTANIKAGDIISVTDGNGNAVTTYVMKVYLDAGGTTISSTGDQNYADKAAVSSEKYKNIPGKVLEISKSVDGLRIQNKDTAGKLSELSMTVDELSTRVTDEVNGLQSEITQTANELSIEITAVSKTSDEALRAAKANANDLSSFSDSVTGSLADLQGQIDGAIETWFYSYVPTSSNYPASSWTTADEQNKHLGDLFYIVDNDEKGGQVYRWALVNGVYSWVVVEDTEVAKALEIASKAQDTADGKRRVFVTTPVPPYDVGDLWSNGTDLYVCQTSRQTGSYSSADWKLATAYTTDAVVTSKIEQLNDSITLKVTSVESKASAAQNTADKAVSDAAGAQSTANTAVSRVSSLAVTVDGIDARVSTSEGNYTSLKQSVSDLAVTVSDADGRITAISATIDGLTIKDSSGTTKISGSSVETSSMLLTGSININDNFLVDSLGNVQLNGNVTWGTGTSPTQVLYASSALTKPTNGTSWSSFPASGTGWHQSFLSSDYYASYTYDGGATWTDAVQVRGINGADGTDGKDGRDGSDAYVDAQNVFNALTSGGTLYGCFSGSSANTLYINASYIRTGILSFGDGSYYIAPYATADYLKLPGLTITSSGAAFSGSVTAVSGQIGNFTISGGYLSYSDSGGTRSQLSPNGTFLFSPTSAGYVQFNYSYANSRYELALGSAAALTIGAYSLTADNLRALLKLI